MEDASTQVYDVETDSETFELGSNTEDTQISPEVVNAVLKQWITEAVRDWCFENVAILSGLVKVPSTPKRKPKRKDEEKPFLKRCKF